MDGDTAKEDRLSVQKNFVALRLNGAETDLIGDGITATGHDYAIELRIFRRPEIELGRKLERAFAAGVGGDSLLDLRFGDFDRDGLRAGGAGDRLT